MNHLSQIIAICLLIILPIGCEDTQKEPVTTGIKIGELSPGGKRKQPKVVHSTNIQVISYELEPENIKAFDNIWKILTGGTIRYNEPNGFAMNGLRAGMGDFEQYNKLMATLKSANAKRIISTSLLLSDNQPEMVNITRLTQSLTIPYFERKGLVKQAQAGPATIGLQVFARQLISSSKSPTSSGVNLRQLASIHVTPAIFAETEGLAPALIERFRENDLRVYSAGFSAIVKPGEFVFLSPIENNPDQASAAYRFFFKQEPKPAIRVFLLVCASIS